MKSFRLMFPTILVTGIFAASVQAATFYYDTSSSSGYQGGIGTWSTSDNYWTTNGTTLQAWTDGSDASFRSSLTAGGTVTVNGAINVNSLTINEPNCVFSAGTGAINLAGIAMVSLGTTGSGSTTFNTGVLGGAGGLTVGLASDTTTQNKVYSYAQDYTGQTALHATVFNAYALGNFGVSSAIGKGTAGTAVLLGGVGTDTSRTAQLIYVGEAATETNRTFTLGYNTTNGAVYGAIMNSSQNDLTLSGAIDGGGAASVIRFRTSTSGSLVLAAQNTYTGTTSIFNTVATDGAVKLGVNNALPTATTVSLGYTSASYNGMLNLNGYDQELAGLTKASDLVPTCTVFNTSTTASNLTLNIAAGLTNTYAGTLGKSGGNNLDLTKNGAGALVLGGANTFAGETTINAGTVQLANAAAAQNSTINLGVANGLAFGSGITTFTLGGLSGDADLALSDTVVLQIGNNGANTTYSGVLSGSGASLTKIGAGELVLGGENTYAGGTTLSSGALLIGADSVGTALSITSSAIGTGAISIAAGTLSSDGTTSRTILNGVSFDGTTRLGNAVNNGKLTFLGGGTLTASRTLAIDSDVEFSSPLVSSVSGALLTKSGYGTLILSGTEDNYRLNIRAKVGTVVLAHADTTGPDAAPNDSHAAAGISAINSGATVQLAGSGDYQLWQGADVQIAGGTFDLNGRNQFSGNTSDETLEFTVNGEGSTIANSAEGTSSSLLTYTTTLATGVIVNTVGDLTLGGSIAGVGGITKTGNGNLTLTGASTYTGATTVSTGTLTLAYGGSMLFDINDAGATELLGSGMAALDGAMVLDVSGVTGATGEWTLLESSLSRNFGDAFTLAISDNPSFTRSGNSWTYEADGKQWKFDGATGGLSLQTIPEPGTIVLLVAGVMGLLAYAWRRRK